MDIKSTFRTQNLPTLRVRENKKTPSAPRAENPDTYTPSQETEKPSFLHSLRPNEAKVNSSLVRGAKVLGTSCVSALISSATNPLVGVIAATALSLGTDALFALTEGKSAKQAIKDGLFESAYSSLLGNQALEFGNPALALGIASTAVTGLTYLQISDNEYRGKQ